MRTTCGQNQVNLFSAQSDVFYSSYFPKNSSKWARLGHEPKKVVVFSGKVENDKYSEDKTWYPESIDGWSYYRLCENF